MITTDRLGNRLSGATAESLVYYESALEQLRCYIGDPVASVDKAIAASPNFVMAHLLRAYLHLVGTEPLATPVAAESIARAAALPANAQEAGHLAAAKALVESRWRDAGRALEDVTIDYPRDALALQVGHAIDFFIGDARMLRDRIARAMPMWSETMPAYHAILSMHAFGLEEMGDYPRAEAEGRQAVALQPRDGWGQHAVAHVMEMQGRQREGIAWMRANPDAWSRESFFAVHNWWHLALYHLDLNEIDEVLKLFDGPIFGARSHVVLEMIDVSALLWRLHLRGIDVGDRWKAIADNWTPLATSGDYPFNDAHAMMAFVGAGRKEEAARLVAWQDEKVQTAHGDPSIFLEIGRPLTRAIKAFGDENYAETVRLLRPVRNVANRFGGSHAQRDLIDLTLIEAAFRSRQHGLAAALSAERVQAKPKSPLARLYVVRAGELAAAS
jgi:hypothetical protein